MDQISDRKCQLFIRSKSLDLISLQFLIDFQTSIFMPYLINFNFFALDKFLFDIFIHSLSPFVFLSSSVFLPLRSRFDFQYTYDQLRSQRYEQRRTRLKTLKKLKFFEILDP